MIGHVKVDGEPADREWQVKKFFGFDNMHGGVFGLFLDHVNYITIAGDSVKFRAVPRNVVYIYAKNCPNSFISLMKPLRFTCLISP